MNNHLEIRMSWDTGCCIHEMAMTVQDEGAVVAAADAHTLLNLHPFPSHNTEIEVMMIFVDC